MSSNFESRLNAQDVPYSPKNPYLKSSLPFTSSMFLRHSRQPSENLGILNQFTLANLVDPNQSTLASPSVEVLGNTKHNKIFFNNEAIKLFYKYEENPIAFVAIYGEKDAGKSFWSDKTYSLADIKNKPQYISDDNFEKRIQFSNVPFTKGNIKIFLLDCSGFDHAQLSREEQIRLDTIMLLSSIVVLLPKPIDQNCQIMRTAYKHFEESQKRLLYSGYPAHKRSSYWPHSLYTLYRTTEPVQKDMEKIGQLFYDYNFSIIHNAKSINFGGQNSQMSRSNMLERTTINEHYLRHVSWVFRDIYEKIQGKKIGKLRITGLVVPELINTAGRQFNSKEKVEIQKIVEETTGILYDREYENQATLYRQNIANSFGKLSKSNGLPLNTVYSNLKMARNTAFKSFDERSQRIDPSSGAAMNCENNFNHLIQAKQKEILQENKSKTQYHLNKTLPHIENYHVKEPEDLKKFLRELKNNGSELQHGRSEVIGDRLKQACDATKQKMFASSQDSMKLFKIQDEISRKKKALEEVEKTKLYKSEKDKKIGEQLLLLQTRNSKLTEDIESWRRRSKLQENAKAGNIEDVDQQRYLQLQKRKVELESRWKQSALSRQEYEKWHKQADRNIGEQTIVTELRKKLEEKQMNQTKLKNTIYESKVNSSMRVGLQGAQKRKIGGEGNIRKSRLTRK